MPQLWQALSPFLSLPETLPAPSSFLLPEPEPLEEPLRHSLQTLLGENRVFCSPELLQAHRGGESYPGFVRRAGGESVPQAIVFPESEQEIAALMEWAGEREIQLLPWGGGTDPFWQKASPTTVFIVVNLARLNRLLETDTTRHQVRVQAGLRWTELEKQLEGTGLTTGQVFASPRATLGGSISSGVWNLKTPGYGNFQDNVIALRAITPAGLLELSKAPPGTPDWRPLLLSSYGKHGIITELQLRLFHRPTLTHTLTAIFPSWDEALEALNQIEVSDFKPAWARLLGPKGAALLTLTERHSRRLSTLLRREELAEGEVELALGLEGREEAPLTRTRQALESLLRSRQGRLENGNSPGPGEEPWRQTLTLFPQLWERGILAHTFCTAAPWTEAAEFRRNWEEALASINEATGGVPGFVFTTLYAAGEYAIFHTLLIGRQAGGEPAALQAQLAAIYEVARETTWRRNRIRTESNLQNDLATALAETLDPNGVLLR